MTITINTDCTTYNPETLIPGIEILRRGGTVIFPTETVYGLGADATSDSACSKIFTAKGRPQDNPLIIHLSDTSDLNRYGYWDEVEKAKELERLWPGPLTVIVRKRDIISSVASAGLNTIGMRIPDCNFTRDLIRRSDLPVAAPSANISGRPSATSISHVREELWDRVDLMYNAGRTRIGIESTVILPEGEKCTILRPGAYTEDDLLRIFKKVEYAKTGEKVMSPGMKYRHYSPSKNVYRADPEALLRVIKSRNDILPIVSSELGQMIRGNKLILGSRNDPVSISGNLYNCLRELDKTEYRAGIIEKFDENGYFFSIMNRINRASIPITEMDGFR
ncbi:L-threonylcarbamoyladenylate synthase [Cuniculiplasma divulgatum]|jgi:L-threonylcarbamoyladenylate synthase|uniref:Threonylcarbamoyl-AMP synthase n=1 Tax=Cuniculiplasma divulgatum TaxID=1673428 RepID=A0A1N5T8X6_9ARCH|nr:L-threonylcarbamoyladenylate synthase [Cuniculiplasma divulgatum]MCI2412087.1 threonylcarbamoyl-AMP synthase [Cuniculiplasma sp.]WMT48695.1 MAG: L-threonylcarbamoyladenylate synthase [Thermoplasmatales archaeon]SIM44824.1 L-threonylcarbamoyladenylate synthase Sua5 [Cuniculiplasma divulgatum]